MLASPHSLLLEAVPMVEKKRSYGESFPLRWFKPSMFDESASLFEEAFESQLQDPGLGREQFEIPSLLRARPSRRARPADWTNLLQNPKLLRASPWIGFPVPASESEAFLGRHRKESVDPELLAFSE